MSKINWYKTSQTSSVNALRLFELGPDFSQEELEAAKGAKIAKWEALMGISPHAEEMIKRIDQAYNDLIIWNTTGGEADRNRAEFWLAKASEE